MKSNITYSGRMQVFVSLNKSSLYSIEHAAIATNAAKGYAEANKVT